MGWNSKVVWSEGMLLKPQHLQQHDRYLAMQLELRAKPLACYGWGFSALKLDEAALALGKVALASCSAILPDGTPLCLPEQDELPPPLEVPEDARDALVVLALPLRRYGSPETGDDAAPDHAARYRSADQEVWDSNGLDSSALVQTGRLRLALALESQLSPVCTGLGVARIIERRADRQVLLDADYCPPCLDLRASARLAGCADEVLGLLHQRGEALAARLSQPGTSGVAEIADFLLLQLINRAEPLFAHLAGIAGLHPERLYREMLQLAGELSSFARDGRRPGAYPTYRHDRLADSFLPLLGELRASLAVVMDPNVVPIPIEERQFGIRVALLADRELLKSASFVLAVRAQMPAEALRSAFPRQVKIGAIEGIRDLVNLQLPGIVLMPLPVAPRQLPFHAGHCYFELDRGSDYWQRLQQSAGFAIHVAGEFPGLQMQFWAIRR